MDRIDTAVTTSVTPAPVTTSGLGSTFRAIAQGASAERRRRSLLGTARTGRGPAAGADADGTADSGTWRLAL